MSDTTEIFFPSKETPSGGGPFKGEHKEGNGTAEEAEGTRKRLFWTSHEEGKTRLSYEGTNSENRIPP